MPYFTIFLRVLANFCIYSMVTDTYVPQYAQLSRKNHQNSYSSFLLYALPGYFFMNFCLFENQYTPDFF